MVGPIGPFSTATEMLDALGSGRISSVELVEEHLARIDEHDGDLHAIAVPTPARARASAQAADSARARGERRALLGVPLTLKESTQVAGLPQSAGLEVFRDHEPASDGVVAARVFAAGGCLLGKTNVPVALADWQADSPIYGRTNNPWSLDRTPGGSTGGGGAALAAGLTPLEVGSDIGGSIRVPAAYCGVYGHRPSETAVPRTGAFPLADLPNPAFVMGVQGPLARSATDLELLLDVIAGPVVGEGVAWRLELPPARHTRLRDFRVAVMPPMPWVAPSSDMSARVDELAAHCAHAGARVAVAMPDLDFEAYVEDYLATLAIMTSPGQPRAEREASAARASASSSRFIAAMAPGMTLDAVELLALMRRRELAREAWRAFFDEWDLLIGPMVLDAAFPHASGANVDRELEVDGHPVPYLANFVYPMWAIFAGQPSTAFPAGLDRRGLPLGLQAIGPYLEDRTPLQFAQLLERDWNRFEPPPGY